MGLLPEIPRKENGYRVFNDFHLKQLQLLRTAFRCEVLSSNLRNLAIDILKTSASGEISLATKKAKQYLTQIRKEKRQAEEAISIAEQIEKRIEEDFGQIQLKNRKDTASLLGITADVLRDWERNGLIEIPRDQSGYRIYGTREINRLKIIRILRNAHYSQMAIRRMMKSLEQGETNMKEVINTPEEHEDIIYVTDMYLTMLSLAEQDAGRMIGMIGDMK